MFRITSIITGNAPRSTAAASRSREPGTAGELATAHPVHEVRARASTVEARHVCRCFGAKVALDAVSFVARAGEIHALIGPNGAGKTTLLRIISGLLHPDSGAVSVSGLDPRKNPPALRRQVGLVPAGDRSLYLRISGLENLVFFGRLHGLRRKAALARAREVLRFVGLEDAAHVRAGVYSHGMQKRLLVARALLTDPAVLLIDEATHDLDPEAALRVRELVRDAADQGATVIWTTQRIDEIRAFADRVTLLDRGRVGFAGTVAGLMAHGFPRRYLIQVRNGHPGRPVLRGALAQAVAGSAAVENTAEGGDHYLLALNDDAVLGDVLAAVAAADIRLLTCREERSEVEEAFLALTSGSWGSS
jgi:ABC-type multidrug transport system ATPase subunit